MFSDIAFLASSSGASFGEKTSTSGEPLRRFRIMEVRLDDGRWFAACALDLRGEFIQEISTSRRHRDVCALTRQSERDRAPDALACAGNKRGLCGKLKVHV